MQHGIGNPAADECGVLLVGHGTRHAGGQTEFRSLAGLVARMSPGIPVESCFLELAAPPIDAGVEALVNAGIRRLIVAPLLLFSAGHAKRDIPDAVARAAARYTGLSMSQTEHLGCHPRLVELSALRFASALAGQPDVSLSETLLLMVGRGSHDPDANAEMAQFTRLRWERTPTGWAETSFTAMTRPTLSEALPVVAVMPFRRIVVQPHLMFQGELLGQIRNDVGTAAAKHPHREWIVAPHLGPHELLAKALIDRIAAARKARNP